MSVKTTLYVPSRFPKIRDFFKKSRILARASQSSRKIDCCRENGGTCATWHNN